MLIIFVFLVTIMFVVGAIVVDVGLLLTERRRAQTAVDLSSLAAVPSVNDDDLTKIENAAYDYAARNGYDVSDPDVRVDVFWPPKTGTTSAI